MTWVLVSVSYKITGMAWDNHHQMSFPSKNFLFTCDNHEVLAVIHQYTSLNTNTQHWTVLQQITGWLQTPATYSFTWYDSSWVGCDSCLFLITFWREAYYIFLRTSNFFSISPSSPYPDKQIIATQTPQPGESKSKSSKTMDTLLD